MLEKTRQMGFNHATLEQYLEAVAKIPQPEAAYQAEDRIHPPRKRIGVSIIILDYESEALRNLVEKQRIFNESVAKFA